MVTSKVSDYYAIAIDIAAACCCRDVRKIPSSFWFEADSIAEMELHMDTTVMGLFRDRSVAEQVKAALIKSGLADANISFHPNASQAAGTTQPHHEDHGFWASIKELFTGKEGDDDAAYYRQGVQQGKVMVIAKTTKDRATAVAQIMELFGGTELSQENAKGTAAASQAQCNVPAPARDTRANAAPIPVIQEEIKIGKRQIQGGGVRIVSRVVERPVEEQVSLHTERVTVARQAVGRNLTAAEAEAALAAGERVIETRETNEEAVVSKTARVVEEVVLNKEGQDHTQTVRGKVRSTQVDVEKLNNDKPANSEQQRRGPVESEKARSA